MSILISEPQHEIAHAYVACKPRCWQTPNTPGEIAWYRRVSWCIYPENLVYWVLIVILAVYVFACHVQSRDVLITGTR